MITMLTYLLSDSEWNDRKRELNTQHHLERTELFRLEGVAWQDLEQMHTEQRVQLENQLFNPQALADLISQQMRAIKCWRRDTVASRQAMKIRQSQELAALEGEQPT